MPSRKRSQTLRPREIGRLPVDFTVPETGKLKLEIVLKCDVMGSIEAITNLLAGMKTPDAEIRIIHTGVGPVSKQDLLMALTGSRLVIGFNVGIAPKLEAWVKDHGVEVRLYDVIYGLAEDLKEILRKMTPPEPEEKVTAKCEIIATFKTDKGVILGCQVVEGSVQVGKTFRIVSAMGPVFNSKVESLQVEKRPVKEARFGQQVGIKIPGFSGGKVGDFIECYDTIVPRKTSWTPKGKVVYLTSS